MKYESLLPEWAYTNKELEDIKAVAIDVDKNGYYTY